MGGNSQSHLASDLNIKVTCYKVEQEGGDTNYCPGLGNMSSQVDNDDTLLSWHSLIFITTKHISNEAKQNSLARGKDLSLEEIQSFVEI